MKITVIGGGNMGGAIACGFAGGTIVSADQITVSDKNEQTLARIKGLYPQINTTTDNLSAVSGASLVVVAVKPWLLEEVAAEIRSALDYTTQQVVSIVSGATFEQLLGYFDNGSQRTPALYRVIPNTAISLGESVTYITQQGATEQDIAEVRALFAELGMVLVIDEAAIEGGTSLASCGIAFALRYLDASIKGGVELGFSEEESRAVVIQTMRGALKLLEHNATMPQTEIDRVTTPGGITLRGLEAMSESHFDEAVLEGLKRSKW